MTKERYRLYLCVLLVGAALGSLGMILWSQKTGPCGGHERKSCAAERMMHASALVFVIFGTLLLTIIADTEQQITAAIGVLGAVAGYLFGTMRRDSGKEQTP
jgi:TRAP-type mannitol/chloroaromatic compound transport system permease large subunit